MLAFVFELLAGRYAATSYNDRFKAEWPPHPARFFSALVATWAEAEARESAEQERSAIEWLERLDPPEIYASEAYERTVATVFVPVNDEYVVAPVSRKKLDDANAALAEATDSKERARLVKNVDRLEQKLLQDTAKTVARPTKGRKNDSDALKTLPEHRTKQPRTFPSVTPHRPTFSFLWPNAEPPDPILADLGRIAARLVRVGHSSSMVRCVVTCDQAELEPQIAGLDRRVEDSTFGNEVLRWVSPGQLKRLVALHEQHQSTELRVLPATSVRYRRGEETQTPAPSESVFSENMLVMARCGGPRLPQLSAAGLSRQVRRALMDSAAEPVAEIISGHQSDGSPAESPHLVVAPLPMVFGPKPDGAILGVALILPRDCSDTDRGEIAAALRGLESRGIPASAPGESPVIQIQLGDAGCLELQRSVPGEERLFTLRPEAWSRPSRHWLSATPIALDRHPGDLSAKSPAKRNRAFAEAEESIRNSLKVCGIENLAEITVSRSCVMQGTAEPRNYPRFPINESRPQRLLVHARITFDEPVRGPLLIGAGRFHGLGLLAPVGERSRKASP